MKATLETTNTLFVAVWSEGGRTAILASLRNENGEVEPVGEYLGGNAVKTLARALRGLCCVAATYVIVYANDTDLVELYSKPVRLEPTSRDRMEHYVPEQWEVLHRLSSYASWRMVLTDKLAKTRRLHEASYDLGA